MEFFFFFSLGGVASSPSPLWNSTAIRLEVVPEDAVASFVSGFSCLKEWFPDFSRDKIVARLGSVFFFSFSRLFGNFSLAG